MALTEGFLGYPVRRAMQKVLKTFCSARGIAFVPRSSMLAPVRRHIRSLQPRPRGMIVAPCARIEPIPDRRAAERPPAHRTVRSTVRWTNCCACTGSPVSRSSSQTTYRAWRPAQVRQGAPNSLRKIDFKVPELHSKLKRARS